MPCQITGDLLQLFLINGTVTADIAQHRFPVSNLDIQNIIQIIVILNHHDGIFDNLIGRIVFLIEQFLPRNKEINTLGLIG